MRCIRRHSCRDRSHRRQHDGRDERGQLGNFARPFSRRRRQAYRLRKAPDAAWSEGHEGDEFQRPGRRHVFLRGWCGVQQTWQPRFHRDRHTRNQHPLVQLQVCRQPCDVSRRHRDRHYNGAAWNCASRFHVYSQRTEQRCARPDLQLGIDVGHNCVRRHFCRVHERSDSHRP